MQVDFADYRSDRFADAPDIYTEFRLQSSLDGRTWVPLAETGPERRDRPNAYFDLPTPVRARFVRYVHGHVGAANLAIGDLRVFGNASGSAPRAPRAVTAARDCDGRNASVGWQPVGGAVGYNVRWGVRPERLTLAYQLFADRVPGPRASLALRALNVGEDYAVAVEAFNETGVSQPGRIIRLSPTCK